MMFWPRMLLRNSYCTQTLQYGSKCIGSEYMKQIKKQSNIKKSINIAFVGFANAGKSTLINTMLGLRICAASKRPLTTVECQHVFYVKDDTQITLIDTPGILSRELKSKSDFTDSEYILKTKAVQKTHLVGVIVDASCSFARYDVKSHLKFLTNMFSSDTEFVLILNKVDLVKNKTELLSIAEKYYAMPLARKVESSSKTLQEPRKFSQIFMISALKNKGVRHIVDYLRSIAPEHSGFSPYSLSSHPDNKIVEQTVRASLLEYVPKEIPYKCTFQTEYMAENSAGEFQIVVLIICPSVRCYKAVSSEVLINKVLKYCIKNLQLLFGKRVFLKLQSILDVKEKKETSK